MTEKITIKIERHREVGVITLNRPEVHNALNRQMVGEMVEQLEAFDADTSIRAMVIQGEGAAFAAGADIAELKEASALSLELDDPFRDWDRIKRIHKPIIASVHGFALGGGFELALHSDIILAAENAMFGFPEVTLGVMPGAGGTQLLTRAIGRRKAMELIWLGDTLKAHEAEEFGVVNHVFHEDMLVEETHAFAEKIAKQAPFSVRLIKEAVYAAEDLNVAAGMELERKNFSLTFASNDQSEGMQAFMDKRKPSFKGE